MKKHQLVTLFNLSVVYIVWGSTFYAIKLALEGGLTPSFLIGLRFLFAGSVLYILSRVTEQTAPSRTDWNHAATQSFLLLVCGVGLTAWSQTWLSSGLAALLVATSPIWVTLFDREQKLTLRKWLGLVLGLTGVGLLAGSSLSLEGSGIIWGFLGCTFAAFTWAIGSLRARHLSSTVSAFTRAAMQMICAGITLLLIALFQGEGLAIGQISNEAWWSLTYLSAFGSLLAFSAYTWLTANASAALVSTHAYVNPVVAVLLGAAFGGEILTPQMGVAAATAMLGVVILMAPERPNTAAVPALSLLPATRGHLHSSPPSAARQVS